MKIVPKNVSIFFHFQAFSLISENHPATLYLSTSLQSFRVNLDFDLGQSNGNTATALFNLQMSHKK
jgi:hypothetical protein